MAAAKIKNAWGSLRKERENGEWTLRKWGRASTRQIAKRKVSIIRGIKL